MGGPWFKWYMFIWKHSFNQFFLEQEMVSNPIISFLLLLFCLCRLLLPQKVEIKWKGKYTYFTRMYLWKWCNWIDLIAWVFKILDEYSWSSLHRVQSVFIHLSSAHGGFMWMQISCAVGAETWAGWEQPQVRCHVEAALGFEGQGRFRRWMVLLALKWA